MLPDLTGASWRKSTHSGNGGDCVEVADGIPGVVPVRDSKNPNGGSLIFSTASFAAFVESVRAGEFGEA
ncbi:DUF397 domain-containing protein [Kitasatospora viridis]|uniref:Uncharacterized protein DUF397 n=1 Tax=Kitasatospora viridis TaxID=281105 RepID=A0A561TTE7_9ACTN|nr:DUF397 domain-containing protein [Kitasatospora viridis]TWF90389.1 uncharacterized protein DUF397 [Kitasatospora viridis]